MSKLGNLSTKLALGAGALTLTTLLMAGMLVYGMTNVTRGLNAIQSSEKQMENFAALASQISGFAAATMNAANTADAQVSTDENVTRFQIIVDKTFLALRTHLGELVQIASAHGSDAQTLRATQSIEIARMEALFQSVLRDVKDASNNPASLHTRLNAFSTQITPLLSAAINEERRMRNAEIAQIEALKSQLIRGAWIILTLAIVMLLAYYFGLIRPQFSRLEALRRAAREIGQENFSVTLPEGQTDEIGKVFYETNRMSANLADRRDAVNADWDRLKETIAERTRELTVANDALKDRDIERRKFFADISHEMRTPLTVIMSEAELGAEPSSDPQASFKVIGNRAARLNRRVDDLLRIARSDTGQLSMEAESYPLKDAISDAIQELENRAKREGFSIATDLADVTGFGDANWTRQVVAGLIDNAITHSGGSEVFISLEPQNETARIKVTDNGKGICDPDAAFERFSKGQRSLGFGIGLAFAKWIVEAQKGTMSIAPNGQGVEISLPMTQEATE